MSIAAIGARLLGAATPYRLYAELAVVGALVAACGTQTWHLHSEQAAHAHDVAAAEKARATQLAAALEETERQRVESERRFSTIQGIVDDTIRIAHGAVADLAAARSSHDQLLARANALAAAARQARGNPPAARGGPPAGDPIGVLADVLGRADAAAGFMAGVADARGTAGLGCERSYDALSAR